MSGEMLAPENPGVGLRLHVPDSALPTFRREALDTGHWALPSCGCGQWRGIVLMVAHAKKQAEVGTKREETSPLEPRDGSPAVHRAPPACLPAPARSRLSAPPPATLHAA